MKFKITFAVVTLALAGCVVLPPPERSYDDDAGVTAHPDASPLTSEEPALGWTAATRMSADGKMRLEGAGHVVPSTTRMSRPGGLRLEGRIR